MKRNVLLEFNKLSNAILWEAQKVKTVDPKFLYAVKRNKDKFMPEVLIMQKFAMERKQHEKAQEYQEKRVKICEDLCKRDENGKPIIIENQFQFEQDKYKEFQEQFKALNEEYKEVVDDNKNFEAEVEKLLQEEVDCEIYKIKVDWLPTGVITGDQLVFLYDNGFIDG